MSTEVRSEQSLPATVESYLEQLKGNEALVGIYSDNRFEREALILVPKNPHELVEIFAELNCKSYKVIVHTNDFERSIQNERILSELMRDIKGRKDMNPTAQSFPLIKFGGFKVEIQAGSGCVLYTLSSASAQHNYGLETIIFDYSNPESIKLIQLRKLPDSTRSYNEVTLYVQSERQKMNEVEPLDYIFEFLIGLRGRLQTENNRLKRIG